MKKAFSYVLFFVMMLSLLVYPNHEAYAANVSLGVSSSSVNIGDTVKVTVTVPSSVSATIDLSYSSSLLSFVSASTDVGTNAGIITMNVGKYSLAASNSVTVTFKANTSGTANINASVTSAVDNDTAEVTDLGGASTSIEIKNQVQEPDEPVNPDDPVDPDDPDAPKSADNSLASLKLSHGTLSPSFKYNVTKYTATVGYDVTSVVVSAKASHAKAVIESVTGNGRVALEVGENTIKIVVKAENGVKATYTIVVTRQAEGDVVDPGDSESESESESENTPPSTDDILQWNGQILTPAENIPDDVIPADFQKITVAINSVEVPCLTFANGNLKVLYLIHPDETTGLYVYDEAQHCIYPFVRLVSEKGYVFVLRTDEVPAPENYKACTLSIEGKGVVNAYQFIQPAEENDIISWLFGPETFYAAEAQPADFYLLYGMNQTGETGWYVYDSVDGTFQRFLGSVHNPMIEIGSADDENTNSDVEDEKADATAIAKLEKELAAAKRTQLITLGVAVAVAVILLIVIIVMVVRRRTDDYYDDYDDEEYDEEDYEEELYEETSHDKYAEYEEAQTVNNTVVNRRQAVAPVVGETVASKEAEEDDEIEIEFYEMPQTIVSEQKSVEEVEDDELEIEFYEMPQDTASEKKVVEEVEDDEIEIEFYEMPQETAPEKKVVEEAEDDEIEIEFFDMEELLVNEVVAEAKEAVAETPKVSTPEPAKIKEEKSVLPPNFKIEEPVFVDDDDDDDLEFIELD